MAVIERQRLKEGRSGLVRRCTSHETVAPAGNGLDDAALRPVIIEGAPQRRDLDSQVAVVNRRARPDRFQDLVLYDEIAGMLDQYFENIERP
jgi:hypothetical protein